MAFLLNKTTLFALRLHSQKSDDSLMLSRRGFHVEPGAREKALLAEDPSLRHFKSHRKSLKLHKKVADDLTVIIVSACCSEMYNRAEMQKEARKEKRVRKL